MIEILGKKIAEKREALSLKLIQEKSLKPHIAVICVNKTHAIEVYLRNKKRIADRLGIQMSVFEFPLQVKDSEVSSAIETLNNNPDIDGFFLQLPIPKHFPIASLLNKVNEEKDIDGLSYKNLGLVLQNERHAFLPATVKSILTILSEIADMEDIALPDYLKGKNIVIINHSILIGKPLAMKLVSLQATVTMAHQYTRNLVELTKSADIVISATGVPKLITKNYITSGTVIIDAGISLVNGIVQGDVNSKSVADLEGYITPVPGGVGPVTVISLMENAIDAALRKQQ